MGEWKQVAVVFYVATIIVAVTIVLCFIGFKTYERGWKGKAAGYGDVSISDDEEPLQAATLEEEEEIDLEVNTGTELRTYEKYTDDVPEGKENTEES